MPELFCDGICAGAFIRLVAIQNHPMIATPIAVVQFIATGIHATVPFSSISFINFQKEQSDVRVS